MTSVFTPQGLQGAIIGGYRWCKQTVHQRCNIRDDLQFSMSTCQDLTIDDAFEHTGKVCTSCMRSV